MSANKIYVPKNRVNFDDLGVISEKNQKKKLWAIFEFLVEFRQL